MNKATLLLLLSGCNAGAGALNVTTWGEDYIEVEIPASPRGEEPGFVDGFTVKYQKFLLALSDVEIADHRGDLGAELATQAIFDLRRPGPTAVSTFPVLGSQRWDEIAIQVRPAANAVAGNADPADVARMNDAGHSVFVAGTIEKDAVSYTFQWGFDTSTRYHECETDEGERGVVVPNGGEAVVQFTIHGDHFFYDDLQSPETVLRAEALVAADADGDRDITLEELGAVDLTTLPAAQYGTGGDGSVENLRQFVAALSRTLVHFQGEGECKATKQ